MNRIFAVLAVVILVTACGGDRATISGRFAGISNDTVYLQLATTQATAVVDTALVDDKGGFDFRVKLPSKAPTFYYIMFHRDMIPLLISPGERIRVNSLSNITRNYEVEGSEGSMRLREFSTGFYDGVERLDSLSNAYSSLPSSPVYDSQRDALLKDYTKVYLNLKRENIAFIVKNAKSMAAVFALYQKLPNNQPLFNISEDLPYFRMVYDSLSTVYPESRHVVALGNDLDRQDKLVALSNEINAQMDNNSRPYPDLDMQDMYGNYHKLSSFDGKVLLIDFWMSANDPSRIYNAELKEVYGLYHSAGFEVYQISLDTSKATWVNSVQEQKLPWTTVCDFRGAGSPAAMNFGIQSIPTNILVDKDGNVVGRNFYGNRLKSKVAELTR